MRFPLTRARAAAVLACLSLPGLAGGEQALAQAKKPAAPAAAPAAPAAQAPAGQPAPAAAPPGPVRVDLVPMQPDWTKVCATDKGNGKQVCYTTRDYSAVNDQVPAVSVVVYEIKGDDLRVIRFLMPSGLLLRPGIRISFDKGPQIEGSFEMCMGNGCFAESKVKSPTVDQMKKATTLVVAVRNAVSNEVDFAIPLGGFGKAYDGAPIDPKVLQAQQEEMQKQMEAKAQQQRQLLEQQQKAAAPPATGAAPATAPAQ